MVAKPVTPSSVFLEGSSETFNVQERAIECHIKGAMEHIRAALHLLSQKKKRVVGFTGQQFLKDAFSILQMTRRFLPSFLISQPDLMLYTEKDLIWNIGDKFKDLEASLSFLTEVTDSGGVDSEGFRLEVQRIGSELLTCVSSFLGDVSHLSEDVQHNFSQVERSLVEILLFTSESRFIENLRRPGVRSDLEKVYSCLSGFMKSYVREKRDEIENTRRTDRIRQKRGERNNSSLRLSRQFLVE